MLDATDPMMIEQVKSIPLKYLLRSDSKHLHEFLEKHGTTYDVPSTRLFKGDN